MPRGYLVAEMDITKKQRTVQRTLFTKSLNNFTAKCNDATVSSDERQVALQMLEPKMQELELINTKYIDLLLKSDVVEKDIEAEIEAHDVYKQKFLEARLSFLGQLNINIQQEVYPNQTTTQSEKPFKRPFLKIVKYSGGVSTWLQFWSHFRKIHDDKTISKEDKLEYLKQMMEEGSKAENIIHGFPTTAKNYDKAFESLKNRFGRDDLLIEFYTRELLSLALQNATNKGKQISVSAIYDKISAHIRALETLGVKTNNCATMLYPLVESSLPEEILRTWQRSMVSSTINNETTEGGEIPDRLTRLLQFLKAEVSNEERISMAINGFTITEKKSKDNKGKDKVAPSVEQPSASALFSGEEKRKKCIFCGDNHDNANCEQAKKLSYDDRKNLIKEKKCCFKCLKPNHQSKSCKVKISCAWCNNRHSILICQNMSSATTKVIPDKNEASDKKENVEQSLANFISMPEVILQTLRVVLYSDSKEKKIVRVIIDPGSHRSYIRSDVAKSLKYESLGKKSVSHALFGDVNSKSKKHDIYLIHMKSLDGKYARNFQVMNEDIIICNDIPKIAKAPWIEELKRKEFKSNNISLTDLESNKDDSNKIIDLLIGADVADKLFTGKKYDLSNQLSAFETRLGWVIMGKEPINKREDCTFSELSLFVNEAKVSDLWKLYVIGIKDPIEKADQFSKEQKVKDNFLKTVSLNENSRCTVDLPWVENHAPVSHNFDIAKSRLNSTVKKLNKEGLYNKYDKILTEWLEQNIIERVPDDELKNPAHYLPHRHVVKNEGTTPIRPVFDASASEKGFPSLNQCLEKGPNLIELIPAILLRFRENDIAVLADIRKAFL